MCNIIKKSQAKHWEHYEIDLVPSCVRSIYFVHSFYVKLIFAFVYLTKHMATLYMRVCERNSVFLCVLCSMIVCKFVVSYHLVWLFGRIAHNGRYLIPFIELNWTFSSNDRYVWPWAWIIRKKMEPNHTYLCNTSPTTTHNQLTVAYLLIKTIR